MSTPRLALLIMATAALSFGCDEKRGGGGNAGAGAGAGQGGEGGANEGVAEGGQGEGGQAGGEGVAGPEGEGGADEGTDEGTPNEGAPQGGEGNEGDEGEGGREGGQVGEGVNEGVEGEGREGEGGEGEGEGTDEEPPDEGGDEGAGDFQPGEGEGEAGPQACGGIAGLVCADADNEFCSYPAESCGAVDELGECRPRPGFCAQTCPRVCGCDGVDYCNECIAAANGTSTAYRGRCEPEPGVVDTCIPTSHPDVRVVSDEIADCAAMDFACGDDERQYTDACSCGCIADTGAAFVCENDQDCVPEDCCRPTGCVAQASRECRSQACCECDDCLPAVEACGCVQGLCRTEWDLNACE